MSPKSLAALTVWLLISLNLAQPAFGFFGGETGTLDVVELQPKGWESLPQSLQKDCAVYITPDVYRRILFRLSFARQVPIPGYSGLLASRDGTTLTAIYGAKIFPIYVDSARAPY